MAERTVLAALTGAVLDAAVALGLSERALLAAAGLERAELADPDARVPLEAHARLWEAISTARGNVGLSLGPRLARHALGVVGLAMRASETIGDALGVLARFRPLVLADAVPTVEVDGDLLVFRQTMPPRFSRLRHPAEAQAAAATSLLRFLAREEVVPSRVAFPHAAPTDPRPHAALFGRPPHWGAPCLELAFDARIVGRPLVQADPALFAYLTQRAASLLSGVRDEAPVAERVRAVVNDFLVDGEPRLDDVARRLAIAPRTLHRRLRDAGTSFAAVLDDVRRSRAEALLADSALGAYEIGFMLGYSDAAAFTRAFRRWTGTTPAAFRAARAGGASGPPPKLGK
jgi:AraC-like DNA-binding protein